MEKRTPVTYAADRVKCILGGNHIASGLSKDSFIKITPNGGDFSYASGAYGEVVRSKDTSRMYTVNIVTDYGSHTDAWLKNRQKMDANSYDGMFDMVVRDLGSNPLFTGQGCTIVNQAERTYGAAAGTTSWNILVAYGDYE